MPRRIRENPYYVCAGTQEEESTEEENKWEETNYDDFGYDEEEQWEEEQWDDYEVDYEEINWEEDFGTDFDFEEDFGFYDLAGDREDHTHGEGNSTEEDWDNYADIYYGDDATNWTRPSEEFEDFGFEEWEDDESYDFDSDESWSDDGTWTDDYGQEYHNYTYAGEEEGSGYSV